MGYAPIEHQWKQHLGGLNELVYTVSFKFFHKGFFDRGLHRQPAPAEMFGDDCSKIVSSQGKNLRIMSRFNLI